MGIDAATARFLCGAARCGVNFSNTATLGRQGFFPGGEELEELFDALGVRANAAEFIRSNTFGEGFLALLGAKQVESFDVSAYEGATVIHDMNDPIPGEWNQRFTSVIDSGTIEHVFNVPQALTNCMRMVQVGGHFLQITVANNFCGHGFWQFTPELVFRALAPANGFRVIAVLMHELVPGGRWFRVLDPDIHQQRVELCNAVPTYMLTIAQRTSDTSIFATTPQQSDYVNAWSDASAKAAGTPSATAAPQNGGGIASLRRAYRLLPTPLRKMIRRALLLDRPRATDFPNRRGFQQPCYTQLSKADVLLGRLG